MTRSLREELALLLRRPQQTPAAELLGEVARLQAELQRWRELRTMGGPPRPYTHDWANRALPRVETAELIELGDRVVTAMNEQNGGETR